MPKPTSMTKRAFLFQLDLRQIMVPVRDEMLISCSSLKGPCFGGGHDLCITDKCNK